MQIPRTRNLTVLIGINSILQLPSYSSLYLSFVVERTYFVRQGQTQVHTEHVTEHPLFNVLLVDKYGMLLL